MNNNYQNGYINYPYSDNSEERFLIAPFLLGGIAGTALGYGIANNQGNNQIYYPVYPYPIYQYTPYTTYPTYSTSNNYYY